MIHKSILYLKKFDWVLFFSVSLLVCFGIIEIYSVALGQGDASLLNFKKQVFFSIIGIILLFFFAFIDYHNLRNLGNYFFIFGFFLLIAVLFFGMTIRGTRGWFYFGSFGFQPVEFIKIILIIFLARYFSSNSLKIKPLKHIIITGLFFSIAIFLVLKQPDFGSALIILMFWVAMILLAGIEKKYFLIIMLLFILLFSFSWAFYLEPYQKQRIMTFLNPSFAPLEQGYNINQAMIAVGAGRIMGRGIGFGSQSQLKFLPESQNDFIFAVVAEELGFLGVMLVIICFAIFFYRSFAATRKVNNDFGAFFIMGAVCLIFIEMFINIGMNIGLLPVVGISLPFLSYGGSTMISNLILVGIMESIITRAKINY